MNISKRISVNKRLMLAVLFFGVIALSLIVCCQAPDEHSKPYLILYAFDAEGQLLAENMDIVQKHRILGRPVLSGRLSGKDIILAESGIGMTNAAMTTQKLIDRFKPKAVIFTGIAGAIDSVVHIGDITICEKWITHDYVYHGKEGPQPKNIGVYSPSADSLIRISFCSVDSSLFDKAVMISGEQVSFQSIGERTPNILTGGVGVSGNAFIDNYNKRIWLQETFDAQVTDMETAAVAQVCFVNDIPFIAFRSASDLAGGSDSKSAREELNQFFKVAAVNSSTVVIEYLQSL